MIRMQPNATPSILPRPRPLPLRIQSKCPSSSFFACSSASKLLLCSVACTVPCAVHHRDEASIGDQNTERTGGKARN